MIKMCEECSWVEEDGYVYNGGHLGVVADAAKAAVARGIEWLDQNGPEDWRDRISTDDLDMAFPDACIMGQVYEGFRTYRTGWSFWVSRYGGAASGVDLGFRDGDHGRTFVGYGDLEVAWRSALS